MSLVQMPAPLGTRMALNAALSGLSCEYRSEPIPRNTCRLVADTDATLKQQVFSLPQRKQILDVHHHCDPITSGELSKYRNGYCIAGGNGASDPGSSRIRLTMPLETICRYSGSALFDVHIHLLFATHRREAIVIKWWSH